MEDVVEGKDFSFPAEEEAVLRLWRDIDAFKQQLKRTEGKKEYVFYDGPPFATGLPHYGHILAGTLKDVVTRYASMTGHHVERRFGWDCHGLPVEYEIDKKLGIKTPEDVEALGIDKYNEECRAIVMRYAGEWRDTVTRLGRWIDFDNDYKTLHLPFMESVWWVFGQLWDKGLVYRGFKVMPFSTACSTTLSNFEAGLNYKDVSDPTVLAAFPLRGDADGAALVAWTTTPWTLPSNLALCVHPDFDYVKVRAAVGGAVYVVAEARVSFLPGGAPKGKAKKGEEAAYTVVERMKGSELAGREYEPLFDYFVPAYAATAWRVVADTYVTDDSGTGVVHQAPAFGEDDYRVCLAAGIVPKGASVPCPVDNAGRFTGEVADFAGVHVKEADKGLVAAIKAKGRLVAAGSVVHSYPFCWRSDTPLIYKAVPSWFVSVESIRARVLACNEETYWVPAYVKEKRFANWLEGARDWAVSRSRYWGTPLPIWESDDGEERVVVSSVEQLYELTGERVTDLHRHFIDHLTIPSRRGKGTLRRVPDVFDCWFESGSMPYAQAHYPFENKERFEAAFPADFIAEGLDQTRGWFYTLMVLSTALFDRPAFKSLVCNGMVLAADGKKMSKRLKNYPDPNEVVAKYGADALRLYLVNSPVVRAESLRFEERGVFEVVKAVFLPWYNAYRFLAQNVARTRAEGGAFDPTATLAAAPPRNVLDRWLQAATRTLVAGVRREMDAYRLYSVVPNLVRFIEELTNIYVRYNRGRLKGKAGADDGAVALATLFDSLAKVCITMAPLTPFLTETMWQNLRRSMPEGAPRSVHWADVPAAEAAHEGDERIEESVHRMQTVIEMGRATRERHNRPLRQPLRALTVAHGDPSFLADLDGELAAYVKGELNVAELGTAAPDAYSTMTVQPNFQALGRRLGKDMRAVKEGVQALSHDDIVRFQREGTMTVAGHELGRDDVAVKREMRELGGEVCASTDGDVIVVLDLAEDDALRARGVARELTNRFQRLRKKARLQPGDAVDLFFAVAAPAKGAAGDDHAAELAAAVTVEAAYLADALGTRPLPDARRPRGAVVIDEEASSLVLPSGAVAALTARLASPAPALCGAAVARDYGSVAASGAEAFVASHEAQALQRAAGAGGGAVEVHLDGDLRRLVVGEHLFWRVSDMP